MNLGPRPRHAAVTGSSAHLTASFDYHEDDACPDQTATVQVWLSSLHRIDTAHLDGVLLAGPVEVPLVQYSTPSETDIVLPVDLTPGLWGVWVVLDEADAPFFTCDNHYHGAAGATVLKVLAPEVTASRPSARPMLSRRSSVEDQAARRCTNSREPPRIRRPPRGVREQCRGRP